VAGVVCARTGLRHPGSWEAQFLDTVGVAPPLCSLETLSGCSDGSQACPIAM